MLASQEGWLFFCEDRYCISANSALFDHRLALIPLSRASLGIETPGWNDASISRCLNSGG